MKTCKVSQLLYKKFQHNAKFKTQSVGPMRQHLKPKMSFSLPLYWKVLGLSYPKLLQVARETWLKKKIRKAKVRKLLTYKTGNEQWWAPVNR